MSLGQASLAAIVGKQIFCPSGQQPRSSLPGQAGRRWEQVGVMPTSCYGYGNRLLVACRTQEGRQPVFPARSCSSGVASKHSKHPDTFLLCGSSRGTQSLVLDKCPAAEPHPWKALLSHLLDLALVNQESAGPLVWLSGLFPKVPRPPLCGRVIVVMVLLWRP